MLLITKSLNTTNLLIIMSIALNLVFTIHRAWNAKVKKIISNIKINIFLWEEIIIGKSNLVSLNF